MVTKWGWQLLQLSRKLWVRTVAFALLALLSALVAVLLQDLIPASIAGVIGAGAAEKILSILASSMLAVTSIILLNTNLYNERGEVVLFITTIVVTALIVITILVWINHLSGLGRVGETANRVEDKAYAALMAVVNEPWLGANPLAALTEVPKRAKAYVTQTIGYIQHVDVKAINSWAQANDCRVFIVVRAGVFIHPGRPLMWIDGELPDNTDSLSKAFSIDDFRSFDQDPRFGLLVLAEIASKALSPAVNDPGTAIEIIGRGMRVLSNWQQPKSSDSEICYTRVWQLGLDLADLFDDFFTPIARDGAALVEIHIRLQKSFLALANINPQLRIEARRHSEAALARAEQAQTYASDLARLKALHQQLMHT